MICMYDNYHNYLKPFPKRKGTLYVQYIHMYRYELRRWMKLILQLAYIKPQHLQILGEQDNDNQLLGVGEVTFDCKNAAVI